MAPVSEENKNQMERKKGFARLWEVLDRDYMKFLLSGALALLGLIPFGAACTVATVLNSAALALVLGGLGGIIAAPMLCGILDTCLRALRDEPGFWWMTYRAAWKQNVKSALLPGAVFGAAMSAVIVSLYYTDLGQMSNLALLLSLLGVLLLVSMMLLVFVQIPLMRLSFFQMMRNALMLFIRLTGKSLLASAVITVYSVLITAFFPSSLFFLMILNTWFPLLISLMVLYKELDAIFQIESRKNAQ